MLIRGCALRSSWTHVDRAVAVDFHVADCLFEFGFESLAFSVDDDRLTATNRKSLFWGSIAEMPNGLEPIPVQTVDEAIRTMERLDAGLPESDGLKWFNFLYLSVTRAIQARLNGDAMFFSDPVWINRLDVVFANLYFAAVSAAQDDPNTLPHAWRPLFGNRSKPGIARIQYALAGMNAHINRDLVVALLTIYGQDSEAPDRTSARFQDYRRVNDVLLQVESQTRNILLVGTPLASDAPFAPLEDIIAMWSVRAARDAAWDHSQSLWRLRSVESIRVGV